MLCRILVAFSATCGNAAIVVKTSTSIRIDPEVARRLDAASATTGLDKTRIITLALTRILDLYDQIGWDAFKPKEIGDVSLKQLGDAEKKLTSAPNAVRKKTRSPRT